MRKSWKIFLSKIKTEIILKLFIYQLFFLEGIEENTRVLKIINKIRVPVEETRY